MTPIEMREALESMGLIEAADRPGTYALIMAVPDGVEAVQRARLEAADFPFDDAMAEQLAAADRVLYVGSTSRPIRERISEHLEGKVRRASLLQAFFVTGIEGVWPGEYADKHERNMAERNRARELTGPETICWCDGSLF